MDRRPLDTEYMKVRIPNSEATSSQQREACRINVYISFIVMLYLQAFK